MTTGEKLKKRQSKRDHRVAKGVGPGNAWGKRRRCERELFSPLTCCILLPECSWHSSPLGRTWGGGICRQAVVERSELSALLTEEDCRAPEAGVADHPHRARLQPGVLRPLAAEGHISSPPPLSQLRPGQVGTGPKPHSLRMEPWTLLTIVEVDCLN